MRNLFTSLSIAAFLILVISCVEPFDKTFSISKKIIFVDATINDLVQTQSLTIKETIPSANGSYFTGVSKANVTILVDEKESIKLTEKSSGVYNLPDNFKAIEGKSYKLHFTTAEGTEYESTAEKLINTPQIDKVYQKLETSGIETAAGYNPAHYIYIDTKDPADTQNYYLWSWSLWEKQGYCASCEGGKFYTSPEPTGKCVEDARLKRAGTIYDYVCDSKCWEILYNKELNVMSDALSNGQSINARLVAKVPYYQYENALIEVKQQSVSPNAYRYLKLLIDQSQNTGSLADTPPAALVGNIKCLTNKDESVGGYFMVTSVKVMRHWINREDINALKLKPLGLLNGRTANPEPMGSDITRPPLAHCLESKSRTAKKPIGWID